MSQTAASASPPSGLCRSGAAAAVALVAAIGWVFVAPAAAAGAGVPASQPLIVLLHGHVARAAPSARAARIEAVDARRPLTRVRTVLPVLGRAAGRAGHHWVQVRLPGRPNGHKGWISTNRTRRTATEWRLMVELSARRVTVYRGGSVRRHFRAIVGKPSTPTPRGVFFVEEALALSSYEAGGPFALATSARSNVFQEFEGGPGQIGIHGTDNLTGALGTAVSHGCIRLGTNAVTWLARRIGAGVPLTIAR
jgi:lipoprotein-anchoring transpeptidase ErfK/SrfK